MKGGLLVGLLEVILRLILVGGAVVMVWLAPNELMAALGCGVIAELAITTLRSEKK